MFKWFLPLLAVAATPANAAPPTPVTDAPLILAFGDSLTAGYGLGPGLGRG
jgi:lysophospholipase L1-like esterase